MINYSVSRETGIKIFFEDTITSFLFHVKQLDATHFPFYIIMIQPFNWLDCEVFHVEHQAISSRTAFHI